MRDPSMIASDPEISAWVRRQCRRRQDLYPGQSGGAAAAGRCRSRRKILCLTFHQGGRRRKMQDRLFKQLGAWSMLAG